MTGFDTSTVNASTVAGLMLFANLVCLALLAVNLWQDRRPFYRDGCSECLSARRRYEDAEHDRRRRDAAIRHEDEMERRRRGAEDDDQFRWR